MSLGGGRTPYSSLDLAEKVWCCAWRSSHIFELKPSKYYYISALKGAHAAFVIFQRRRYVSIATVTSTLRVCNQFLNQLPSSGRCLEHLMVSILLTALFTCIHWFLYWPILSLLHSEYGNSESTVFSFFLFQEEQKLSSMSQVSFVGTKNS